MPVRRSNRPRANKPLFILTAHTPRRLCGLLLTVVLLLFWRFSTRAGEAPGVAFSGNTPLWPKPTLPVLSPLPPSLRSKDIEIVYSTDQFGGFIVRVAGKDFAVGQNHALVGYVQQGSLHWLELGTAPGRQLKVDSQRGRLIADFTCPDSDGGHWNIKQQFSTRGLPSAIDVRIEVTVDQPRAIAFLPLFMVFPGIDSFGASKGQGVFAGLEYLQNEPSSSEADVVGPASKRQVPDTLKITLPLMAIQAEDRYLALVWQMRPHFSALFDSPDRVFSSGGHVFGLLFPGSNGKNRVEGDLLPNSAQVLGAGNTLVLNATLMGGRGTSVVPAIQDYVRLRGLPPMPVANIDKQQYVRQAAGGWLDSKIREGSLVRHAIAGDHFKPAPAADAGLWMDWLALQTQEAGLSQRLRETAGQLLKDIPGSDLNFVGVGHVRYPLPALLYGHVAENAARAAARARSILPGFQPDGSVLYVPSETGPDYSKTHFSREASGLASAAVVELLELASFCGDRDLLATGLRELRALDKFHDGVPRGAQTWECPLHTPDILAAAQMVRAYALGYELTGDAGFLERARYWAWTGVPFVYLVNPTDRPIGLYSTIAVFGATQWKAPVWLGLPVQWCGLVYAESLYRLARYDAAGPWKKLADGITLSGIQQSWPSTEKDMQGLLPDSFVLREQHRNGPAINPATVEACAAHYFSSLPAYDFRCFRTAGVRVHAPGRISGAKESTKEVSFEIEPWPHQAYYILINGLSRKPTLAIDGKITNCSAPHEFLAEEGRLILKLSGRQKIQLGF